MKRLKLKKGWLKLLLIINLLILMTITNNEIIVDIILLNIFVINSKLIYKYGGLE